MAHLTEAERRELLAQSRSDAFRDDLRRLARGPKAAVAVDPDQALAWLQALNECINHRPKPRQRILDRDMQL